MKNLCTLKLYSKTMSQFLLSPLNVGLNWFNNTIKLNIGLTIEALHACMYSLQHNFYAEHQWINKNFRNQEFVSRNRFFITILLIIKILK